MIKILKLTINDEISWKNFSLNVFWEVFPFQLGLFMKQSLTRKINKEMEIQRQGLQPARLLCPWDSPGKNAGDSLPQGIFPAQGILCQVSWIGRWLLSTSVTWEAHGKINEEMEIAGQKHSAGQASRRPSLEGCSSLARGHSIRSPQTLTLVLCHIVAQSFLSVGLCLFFSSSSLYLSSSLFSTTGLPCGSDSKESACNVGDLGLMPGSGRSPAEGNGCLQFSCLENFMDRGAWRAIVPGVTESDMTEWLTLSFSTL